MSVRTIVHAAVVLFGGSLASQAPSLLISPSGPALQSNLGSAACFIGDVDGDGRPEVAFGMPGDGVRFTDSAVRVYRYDGSILRTITGHSGSGFGTTIAATADVDGDSVPDMIVGAPLDNWSGIARSGSLQVVSGATGAAIHTIGGTSMEQRLGTSVAGVGDIDHDGRADFAAGAIEAVPGGLGFVSIWSGRTGTMLATLQGDFAGEGFGFAVARAGDVDGDGTQDISVGAPFASRRAFQGGMVAVFSGASFLPISSKTGVTDFGNLGYALGTLDADWDADGRDDYIASSPRNNDGSGYDAGSVYVFGVFGNVVARFNGAIGDRLGAAVCAGGDVDGDGHRDLAASSLSGYVRVYSGAPGHRLLDTLPALAPNDRFGYAIDMRGDMNNDGFADLAIGSPWDGPERAGRGFVHDLGWKTATTLLTMRGANPGTELGRQIAYVGDLDGDGRSEFAISVPATHRVLVMNYQGAIVLTLAVDTGPVSSPSLAAAGDIDGDGVPDIIVGSPDDGTGGQKAGAVRIFSGASGAQLYQFFGGAWDYLGFAVAGVGDVDQDGYDDFAAGAPEYADPGEPIPTNYVRVWSGRDGHVLGTFVGTPHTEFGRAIARAGDIDGDRVPDILIGAPSATVRANHGGLVEVYSGAAFGLLASKSGNTDFEALGLSVGTLDADWDGDGYDDYIAGSYRNDDGAGVDAGSLFVFNIWGNVVHRMDGAPGDTFGLQVTGGGDVDGDGIMDVAGTSDARGYMRVFAGSPDHRVLRTFPAIGYFPVIDLRGDFDGDGYADLATSSSFADQLTGIAQVYDLRGAGRPAKALLQGRACATTTGSLPHVEVFGRPAVGTLISIGLRGALAGGAVVMNLGFPTSLSLQSIGAPGCTAYAIPSGMSFVTMADARGRAMLSNLMVPLVLELIGVRLDAQWVVFDPSANPLGLAFSNRAALIVGE